MHTKLYRISGNS